MNMFSRNPFSRGGRPSRSDDGQTADRHGELAQRPGVSSEHALRQWRHNLLRRLEPADPKSAVVSRRAEHRRADPKPSPVLPSTGRESRVDPPGLRPAGRRPQRHHEHWIQQFGLHLVTSGTDTVGTTLAATVTSRGSYSAATRTS
jgi:hypothetical protein